MPAQAKGQKQITLEDEDPFFSALTPTELSYFNEYAKRWPGLACQLNQDPGSGHGMHASDLWFHTLIHNMGLIACDSIPPTAPEESNLRMRDPAVRRWMSPTEALATQGFPVHPLFPARPQPLCSFNVVRPQPRKLRAVCGQAGNSMNVNCAGVIDLHYLCCLQPATVSPLVRAVHMANKRKRQASEGAPAATQAMQAKLKGA